MKHKKTLEYISPINRTSHDLIIGGLQCFGGFALFFIFLCLTNQAFAHGMSEAEKQSILAGANLEYL